MGWDFRSPCLCSLVLANGDVSIRQEQDQLESCNVNSNCLLVEY
uniref:Uncharacterized protein n=1 Tax=Arundo donax TaxID=35708 RepID=A0A0A9CAA4_ARUDO